MPEPRRPVAPSLLLLVTAVVALSCDPPPRPAARGLPAPEPARIPAPTAPETTLPTTDVSSSTTDDSDVIVQRKAKNVAYQPQPGLWTITPEPEPDLVLDDELDQLLA